MSPGKPPPHETIPVASEKGAADTDVNQRTGTEDRATRDSFGDMDEAAVESSPCDNPAIVTAVRGAGAAAPQRPKSPANSKSPPATDKDPEAAVRASDRPGRQRPR